MPYSSACVNAWCLLVTPLTLVACQSAPPVEPDEGLIEACEHMTEGPAQAVTASLEGPGPDVSASHTRFDVTLVEYLEQFEGAVSFASGASGDYRFYLDRDVELAITDASGAEVFLEISTTGFDCPAILLYHTFELGVGTYTLTFGPTTATSLSLVVEQAEAHTDL